MPISGALAKMVEQTARWVFGNWDGVRAPHHQDVPCILERVRRTPGILSSDEAMNRKQKVVLTIAITVLLAMGLYPPYADWCEPMDHVTVRYAWILASLRPPDCAEKLPWVWRFDVRRLLVQAGIVLLTGGALYLAMRKRDPIIP